MATIPYVAVQLQTLFGHSWRVTWEEMGDGDVGQVFEQSVASDRSVQVSGTFDSTTVTIEGTNEPCHEPTATPTYATLSNPQGTGLTFAAAAIKQVTEVTAGIRPSVAGGGATDVDVTMICRATI